MQRDLAMPEFLLEDADIIHERMLEKAPPGVSTIEGDFFWDNTRPAAEEKAELVQVKLQNILKLAFTQTSYGVYLEYLGESKGLFKNPATKSTGIIKVKGSSGTIIEKGKIVSTASKEEIEGIEFEFIETKVIDETGVTYINAKCIQTGIIGNAKAGDISILITPINGIESVTNESDFTGGTEIEDEEHFRERILEAEHEETLSGADSDYIKWAKEVSGVGYAYPIPEWNGPGTVKILILDKNSEPANKEIISAVQNYIAPIVPSGQNRGGKAPLGAIVTIDTANILSIVIQASFVFADGYNIQDVLNTIKNKVNSYLKTLNINDVVVYKAIDTIIGSMLLSNEGIKDYSGLTINGQVSNIQLVNQVPLTTEVISI